MVNLMMIHVSHGEFLNGPRDLDPSAMAVSPHDCSILIILLFMILSFAGDRVCGILPWGAFTQYLLAPAATLIKIPDAMSFDEAAGFIMTNATSYVGLVHRCA